jgi:hypothetical protein
MSNISDEREGLYAKARASGKHHRCPECGEYCWPLRAEVEQLTQELQQAQKVNRSLLKQIRSRGVEVGKLTQEKEALLQTYGLKVEDLQRETLRAWEARTRVGNLLEALQDAISDLEQMNRALQQDRGDSIGSLQAEANIRHYRAVLDEKEQNA